MSQRQALSQEFARGRGAFLEAGNNSKRTWPKFSSVLNHIEAVVLSKSGDLQRKEILTKIETVFPAEIRWSPKKKGLHQQKKIRFSGPNNSKSFTTSARNPIGGLFSFLEQKSA